MPLPSRTSRRPPLDSVMDLLSSDYIVLELSRLDPALKHRVQLLIRSTLLRVS
jgi:hypothetical protein